MSIVKFLLNTAIAGAVAGGVYYYLDQNAKRNAAMAEDPEDAPGALDSENIKDAADRAYTTIVHGTEEMTESLKRSVGPQGEQMISDVQDAAGVVHETVVYAGKKIGEIVTDSDSNMQEKTSAVADTVRYAAVDLHDRLRQSLTAAQPDEFEEEPEDEAAAPTDADAESTDTQEVTEADAADADDPDIEVEFYVDDKAAEATEDAAQAEESGATVEVFVEAEADEETPAAENAEAETETVAAPVTDAAQIEEFFDDEESN